MNWINNSEQKPQERTLVFVKTAWDELSHGIWDGKVWVDTKDQYLGEANEVVEWAYPKEYTTITEYLIDKEIENKWFQGVPIVKSGFMFFCEGKQVSGRLVDRILGGKLADIVDIGDGLIEIRFAGVDLSGMEVFPSNVSIDSEGKVNIKTDEKK